MSQNASRLCLVHASKHRIEDKGHMSRGIPVRIGTASSPAGRVIWSKCAKSTHGVAQLRKATALLNLVDGPLDQHLFFLQQTVSACLYHRPPLLRYGSCGLGHANPHGSRWLRGVVRGFRRFAYLVIVPVLCGPLLHSGASVDQCFVGDACAFIRALPAQTPPKVEKRCALGAKWVQNRCKNKFKIAPR